MGQARNEVLLSMSCLRWVEAGLLQHVLHTGNACHGTFFIQIVVNFMHQGRRSCCYAGHRRIVPYSPMMPDMNPGHSESGSDAGRRSSTEITAV